MVVEVNDVTDQEETKSLFELFKRKITGIISYILPLVASMPPMAAWTTVMTVPFALYLFMMLFNLTNSPPLPDLMNPVTLMFTIIQVASITFLLWSIVHLRRSKSGGLVTSGPYRIVRHPQYFALIVLTFLMTLQSVWILRHTLGIGWMSAEQTEILWMLMCGAYTIIAKFEETHLEDTFDSEWTEYSSKTGFLFPLVRFKSHFLEMASGVLIPYIIMEIVLYLTV